MTVRSARWSSSILVVTAVALAATAARLLAAAAGAAADPAAAGVFSAPQADFVVRLVMAEVLARAASGRRDEARQRLERAIENKEIPESLGHYNLACLLATGGDTEGALAALAAAVEAGFSDLAVLASDPDMKPLRGQPQFEKLGRTVLERARAAQQAQQARQAQGPLPKPRLVEGGMAEVSEENTLWVPKLSRFLVAHTFPAADPEAVITTQPGRVGDLLRQWRTEGTAAGLQGFLYDNHDEAHSMMNVAAFPELASLRYCEAARQAFTDLNQIGQLHRGLQVAFLHNAPVIGNASVARVGGAFWRSMPRQAMTSGVQTAMLADQYMNNMLYFYPEHNDHDPGHGDVYPANVPYLITSQGSSGSDQSFLDAVAAMLAAFRPETQRFLIEKQLLMPTVQMIFRSCRKPVADRDDYLSGLAHPPVFDAGTLDVERMVRMAHDLEPGDVPPLVRLRVEEEYLGRPGQDYFEAGGGEKLFDTISAVARVARSARWQRRMVVSLADTKDPNDRPLSFVWRLLRGDPERVRIRPLDPLGTRAEILIDWHPRGVYPGSDLPSSRVDVAAFADNGPRLSAPAFLTWYFPANERRTYEDVPATAAADRRDEVNGDCSRRIVSIERLPAESPDTYVDPLVVTPAVWTDTYRYDDRGNLVGWTRSRPGADEESYTADGRLMSERNDRGEPTETRAVRYVRRQQKPDAWPSLEVETGR
jgi:hypothetical protein